MKVKKEYLEKFNSMDNYPAMKESIKEYLKKPLVMDLTIKEAIWICSFIGECEMTFDNIYKIVENENI
jgi:hypothetical protein